MNGELFIGLVNTVIAGIGVWIAWRHYKLYESPIKQKTDPNSDQE